MLIREIPALLSPGECRDIIKTFESCQDFLSPSEIFDPITRRGQSSVVRTSYSARLTGKIVFDELDRLLSMKFGDGLCLYWHALPEVFRPRDGLMKDEGYTATRYQPGQFYREHVDDGGLLMRRISGCLYLNDDFEGGSLYFPGHELAFKPKAGSAIFFPSNFEYPHEAREVTSGTKWMITTWFK